MLHKILLYLHISSVILSIGPFFILLPMVKKLRHPKSDVQSAYLDAFRFAVRLTKHAGHVLVVTGILLVMISGWSWKTSWIVMTILIMVSSLFFIARAFSPTIRKFADPKQDHEKAIRKLNQAVWAYIALLMLMLWFMVAKPVLW
ncbi:DUF2269 family protein [Neobacillus sp. PS3-34]|uniref:DUF2269 family protein n=1 Tax=Neobacillus sp. PS3-34 TaxID=3070678 RepID=UPI0027DED0BF|nr:DUF2269 family protein [Neobacillus sp. PS3-34]WML50490.1 DUF2269 family protein [Neobacillus sp. PS3-34]